MWARTVRTIARRTGITRRARSVRDRVNIPRTITVGQTSIRVPMILGTRCELTEPWMVEVLGRLLPLRDGAFLDVGVNLGQTLIKLKALDPARRYVGFEPNTACVFYVQELIRENRFENCTVVPVGLFSEDRMSILNLYSDDRTDVAASVVGDRPNKVHARMVVPMVRFGSVAEVLDIDDIAIVKIDVEGAELDVIDSLRDVLVRRRPIVLIEVLPVYTAANDERKARQEELERIFAAMDYEMFRVTKSTDNSFDGLERIESIGIHSDMTRCDYVLVPEEISI